jgi:hypothetical protein
MNPATPRNAAGDAERIGAFAGLAGMVEVGLGSTLHAYRVPLKGHVLAYLQNILLITFGKSLHGRGLFRISFISAMLKAFSPAGAKFRPMIYIFLQGVCFAAPVRFLGWHFFSVVLGSTLMGALTLGLSLCVDYMMFGKSIFDAFSGAIAFASDVLGVDAPSLAVVIGGAFLLKALISFALATTVYYGDAQPLVRLLRRRGEKKRSDVRADHDGKAAPRSARGAARLALRDISRPRFAIMFLISALLLLFFADLSKSDFVSLLVRGLSISYLGFVVIRRIDVRALGVFLDRRMNLGLSESLPAALEVVGRATQSVQNADSDTSARTPCTTHSSCDP